jgi:hypothetical protein
MVFRPSEKPHFHDVPHYRAVNSTRNYSNCAVLDVMPYIYIDLFRLVNLLDHTSSNGARGSVFG